jgi:hypothetical protein
MKKGDKVVRILKERKEVCSNPCPGCWCIRRVGTLVRKYNEKKDGWIGMEEGDNWKVRGWNDKGCPDDSCWFNEKELIVADVE